MPPPVQKSEGGVCTQAKNRLDAKRCCDSEYYLGYEYNEVSLNILQILTEIELFSLLSAIKVEPFVQRCTDIST